MKRVAQNALIVCITVLLTLILLESVVRLAGETDADGQFTFMGYTLESYRLPVSELRANIENYLEQKDRANVVYDEMLGWAHRPNMLGELTTNSKGLRAFRYSRGLRVRREYSAQPSPNTLRIALFGDSFTLGYGVADDETWGHQLEIALNQAGIRAEVMNFGVNGYGMDQAFLRWLHEGRQYSPDMVIFGFQPENLNRNVNIFRKLYYLKSGIPFSKPRFILTDQGLELLNQPALPPEELSAVFESFANHPLAPYEHYYQGRHVAGRWWTSSRLAAFIYEALKQQNEEMREDWGPGSDRGRLGKAIVDAFAADAMAHDAAFFVLHLPSQSDMQSYHNGYPPPYQLLLDHFEDSYRYIALEEHLDLSHADDTYYVYGHYGPEINLIAAQAVAAEALACIESPACDLPRFEDRSALFTS